MRRIVWIQQDPDPGEFRHDLSKQLELLQAEIGGGVREPGKVSAGRAMVAARPSSTGSAVTVTTTGTGALLRCSTRYTSDPVATIASTFRRSSSSARPGRRSGLDSAKRASTTRVLPST